LPWGTEVFAAPVGVVTSMLTMIFSFPLQKPLRGGEI
jgi:hypothetical protein